MIEKNEENGLKPEDINFSSQKSNGSKRSKLSSWLTRRKNTRQRIAETGYTAEEKVQFDKEVAEKKEAIRKANLMSTGYTAEEKVEIRNQAEQERIMSERRKKEELERLIANVDDRNFLMNSNIDYGEGRTLRYLLGLIENNPEIKQKLINRPLIDLGCGVSPYNEIIVASILGASKYVGVEKYHESYITPEKFARIYKQRKVDLNLDQELDIENFDYQIIRDDMLRYLASLPDDSGNIMMNSIDAFILQGDKDGGGEYDVMLIKEIKRVIGEHGVIIMFNSMYLQYDEDLVFVPFGKSDDGCYYKKPSES